MSDKEVEIVEKAMRTIKTQKAEIGKLTEALEFYADEENYKAVKEPKKSELLSPHDKYWISLGCEIRTIKYSTMQDGGKIAREALSQGTKSPNVVQSQGSEESNSPQG